MGEEETTQTTDNNQKEVNEYTLKFGIYTSLKVLYDKWLSSYNDRRYLIKTPQEENEDYQKRCKNSDSRNGTEIAERDTGYFTNFLFVDEFFNDISDKFLCDPEPLYQLIKSHAGAESNYHLYEAMNYFSEQNQLYLRAFPMFNNFYRKDGVVEAFIPYPNFGGFVDDDATYVCMYTSKLSSNNDDSDPNNPFASDTFEITDDSGNINSETAMTLFPESDDLDKLNGDDFNPTRNIIVPTFGVSYAMQNQSYFKNISVNMDSPKMTDYAITNMFNISKVSSVSDLSNPHTIAQNAYTIFSNHSYNCTVEMLGDMQIMPLMYFQLNNIPLFKGAYQVIEVEHSIKGGLMTTKFSGVRMSKYRMPYVNDVIDDRERIEEYKKQLAEAALARTYFDDYQEELENLNFYLSFEKTPTTNVLEDYLYTCLVKENFITIDSKTKKGVTWDKLKSESAVKNVVYDIFKLAFNVKDDAGLYRIGYTNNNNNFATLAQVSDSENIKNGDIIKIDLNEDTSIYALLYRVDGVMKMLLNKDCGYNESNISDLGGKINNIIWYRYHDTNLETAYTKKYPSEYSLSLHINSTKYEDKKDEIRRKTDKKGSSTETDDKKSKTTKELTKLLQEQNKRVNDLWGERTKTVVIDSHYNIKLTYYELLKISETFKKTTTNFNIFKEGVFKTVNYLCEGSRYTNYDRYCKAISYGGVTNVFAVFCSYKKDFASTASNVISHANHLTEGWIERYNKEYNLLKKYKEEANGKTAK